MYVLYIELTFEEYEYAIFFRVFRGTAFHINARFVEFLFHQRHEYARHTYGCLVVLADECVYAGGLPAARHGAKAGKDKDEILHDICFLEFF